MSKVVVAHLTSVHASDDIRIFQKECRSLADAGYEVMLVAPHTHNEQRQGVTVRAVPKARKRWLRMTKTVFGVLRAALEVDADIYHFHDPELIPVGLLLKLGKAKVIYDAHEDLPRQIISKEWIPKPIRSITSRVAAVIIRFCASRIDGVIAATPSIAGSFNIPTVQVVQNFPIEGELATTHPIPYTSRENLAAYVGGITAIRGVREAIAALELVQPDFKLAIAGSFAPPRLEDEFRRMPGWKQVEYLGWQTRDGVRQLLSRARIGVVTFHPVPNHLESQPNKLFEYMSAGIPIIASDFPVWRQVVQEVGCGLLVDPQNPVGVANAINWLLAHPTEAAAMGERGRAAVQTKYQWGVEERKLLSFYEATLNSR